MNDIERLKQAPLFKFMDEDEIGGIRSIMDTHTYLALNALWFGGWLLWNQPWMGRLVFDPYPFGLLTMIVSLEAIFLSIFVLISQNRQAVKDRLSADIDHQVNTKAELEIGLVLHRLDDLDRNMKHSHAEQVRLIEAVSANGRRPELRQ